MKLGDKHSMIVLIGIFSVIILFAVFGGSKTQYQETADYYSCSGDWYINQPCSHLYDGDWESHGYSVVPSHYGELYMEYLKPKNANSMSKWKVKDKEGTFELAIPSSCWNYSPDELMLKITSGYNDVNYLCYDGTWILLRNYKKNNVVYEEGMNWKMGNSFIMSVIGEPSEQSGSVGSSPSKV